VSAHSAGRRARFQTVPVASATYDSSTRTVTIVLRRRLNLSHLARLRIRTTTPLGLPDDRGQRLANAQGQPADFTGEFRRGGLIPPQR
jgi:hypothetical protein